MIERRTFECLRCDHHYEGDYDPKQVVERTCPKCGSNSVRAMPRKPVKSGTSGKESK
jgi:predicted  nucleic acid-binding Zn-ribbon protein